MKPAITVPRWAQRPSGLIVPVDHGRPASSSSSAVPAELVPDPEFAVVLNERPTSYDQMRAFVDERALGLPVSGLPDVVELCSAISFETAMVAISQVAAAAAHADSDEQQLELAAMVYGAPGIVDAMAEFLRGHPGGRLFAEQHFFVLQRLLVLQSIDRPFGAHDPAEGPLIERALLAVSALTEADADLVPDRSSMRDWLPFLVQNGAYNATEPPMEGMARAYEMFSVLARSEEARAHQDFVDLEVWAVEDTGFTPAEQAAIGFAALGATKAFDEGVGLAERCVVASDYAQQLAVQLGRPDDEDKVLDLISADRDWYAECFASDSDRRHAVWNRVPFEQRPFLRLASGQLLLVAPRAIGSWMTQGFYYRLLSAAQARGQQRRFLRFVGWLTERYSLELMRSVHPGPRLPGGGVVHGELRYGRGGGQLTPDIAIDLGQDLVLVEVISHRLTVKARLLGESEQIEDELDRGVVRKVLQLDRRIKDLLEGKVSLPGVEIDQVRRIWPVVVHAADLLQSEMLWEYLDEHTRDAFADARLRPVQLLDLGDLEQLAGLIESGWAAHDLLQRKAAGPYSRLDFARFVYDDPFLPERPRAESTIRSYEEFCRVMVEALGWDWDPSRLHE